MEPVIKRLERLEGVVERLEGLEAVVRPARESAGEGRRDQRGKRGRRLPATDMLAWQSMSACDFRKTGGWRSKGGIVARRMAV